MRVLFDQGTPVPLRGYLRHHSVATAYEMDWSTLKNGDLLNVAECEGFQVIVTTDMNLRYQQNLTARVIAVVVLGTTSWPRIKTKATLVVAVFDLAMPRVSRVTID